MRKLEKQIFFYKIHSEEASSELFEGQTAIWLEPHYRSCLCEVGMHPTEWRMREKKGTYTNRDNKRATKSRK
jgi:hypothetical protein